MELVLMQDTDIFVKTDAGRDEIKSRTLGLPMSIRAILLMIDGQRNVAAMRGIIAGSKAPADVLDGLLARGLIEPMTAPAPAVARAAPSISVPRPASAPPVPMQAVPAVPRSAATRPAEQAFVLDGPLDLMLPTIHGATASPVAEGAAAAASAAVVPVNRYEHLYAMMNEIVRDFLSPTKRYFFQLKIERCTTPEELLELLHDLQTSLSKTRGDAFASDVISRLRNAAL